jgi:uncharacterized protein (DUF4415 family)
MRKEYDLKTLKVVRRGISPELHHAMKQRITIALDQDVVEFFKELAKAPGALPYQTQVNQALREYIQQMIHDKKEKDLTSIKVKLLKDPKFINAIAKQIEQRQ